MKIRKSEQEKLIQRDRKPAINGPVPRTSICMRPDHCVRTGILTEDGAEVIMINGREMLAYGTGGQFHGAISSPKPPIHNMAAVATYLLNR